MVGLVAASSSRHIRCNDISFLCPLSLAIDLISTDFKSFYSAEKARFAIVEGGPDR